jgi:hypothetical protein
LRDVSRRAAVEHYLPDGLRMLRILSRSRNLVGQTRNQRDDVLLVCLGMASMQIRLILCQNRVKYLPKP